MVCAYTGSAATDRIPATIAPVMNIFIRFSFGKPRGGNATACALVPGTGGN
jgi:hypothetical protein